MTSTITTDSVSLTYTDAGSGSPVLLLHGGGGPRSVAAFAAQFAEQGHRVLTPVHPGFDGSPRPTDMTSIAGLAALYVELLGDLELSEVTVVGNSIGGWIAAEMNILGSPRVARVALVDAVGLALPEHPIVDFFDLSMHEVVDRSYREPDRFRIDLSSMSDADKTIMAANRATLSVYGGTSMTDPTLSARLNRSTAPTLVVWGAADRIVPTEHAHAYADKIPDARIAIIDSAGHMPQIETPDILATILDEFITEPVG